MSDELAEEFMDTLAKRDRREERRNFIAKMEHKLHSKERRMYRTIQ